MSTAQPVEPAAMQHELCDPDAPYVLDKRQLKSRSKNSPFDEARLQGAAVLTLVAGREVFRHDAFTQDASAGTA